MKEVKAYVRRDRVADVIAALKESLAWGGVSGDVAHGLAVYLVRSVVAPPDADDRHYSIDLGDEIVNEYKLELICEDAEVDALVAVIAEKAHTGREMAGWITVANLERAERIL